LSSSCKCSYKMSSSYKLLDFIFVAVITWFNNQILISTMKKSSHPSNFEIQVDTVLNWFWAQNRNFHPWSYHFAFTAISIMTRVLLLLVTDPGLAVEIRLFVSWTNKRLHVNKIKIAKWSLITQKPFRCPSTFSLPL
jgi:hypothetical protein